MAILLPIVFASACNKDDDKKDDNQSSITNIHSVAITKFALQSNSSVMRGLDSVYFAIDLENGVIFNADSLPKGTDVSKLATTITFYNAISEAVYTMENGSHRTGESDYRTSPNDTIDFTGDVSLRVVSADGENSMVYRIKVNVHKMDPDSLAWTDEAIAALPSRMADPRAQSTVRLADDNALCIIEESDGSYTLARSDRQAKQWVKSELNMAFTPNLGSLTAADDALYMLDADGNLYSSADGNAWTATGNKWISITGAYGRHALGIVSDGNGMRHTAYPADGAIADSPVADTFPISGASNMVTVANRWASTPTALLAGGTDALGRPQSATWAFDGARWASISNAPAPALNGASLIPYFAFRKAYTGQKVNEFPVWMLIGGTLADGSINRKVYLSYDNGINWREGSDHLNMPDYLPAVTDADFIVLRTPLEASLAGWKIAPKRPLPAGARIAYRTDGDDIFWDCPYIYMFGGIRADGALNNAIWRGVLNRLSFKPLI